VYLYERITGQPFQVPDLSSTTHERILKNLQAAGL
jgi:phosphoribosylaminoimidazole-succinocarboxamide synthase